MASGINGNINQLLRNNNSLKTQSPGLKAKVPSDAKGNKNASKISDNIFGAEAKVELSPEAEMFGKVVDMLSKKYENADIFVAGPDDDLSKIGGDLEYSIILSEDEMKLLSSDDPKDKKAKEKLMGQIDEAMSTISKMSEKIGESTDEKDEISNFGLKFDKNGKMSFFADINGKSYSDDSVDSIVQKLMEDKK